MNVYLDESGDLGWILDQPFRRGGSSRYLTLSFVFVPYNVKRYPRNIILSMYKQFGWTSEKKASSATPKQKILFCEKAVEMLEKHNSIRIHALTVKKANVKQHIREDPNKLYNYMTGLVLPKYVESEPQIQFIPDERTVKVASGNSLTEYLQIKLWFEHNLTTKIINMPGRSHENYTLQFADWIAHCVWIKHEDGISKPHQILRPHIDVAHLYF